MVLIWCVLEYMYMNTIYTIIGIIIVWSLWGYLSSRVETSSYAVIENKDGYEIRVYPAHIVAQTTVSGSYDEALSQGFRIIAGYIFGGNTKRESISMTSPVTEQNTSSESIAMTAPVLATVDGGEHTISFGMPRAYSLDTLPIPNDNRVKLVTIPEMHMAVIRFSWLRTYSRVEKKKKELLTILQNDNYIVKGEPQYAGYNAPWTPPWMTRHEVMLEINN